MCVYVVTCLQNAFVLLQYCDCDCARQLETLVTDLSQSYRCYKK